MKHFFEQTSDGTDVVDQPNGFRLSAKNRARANARLRTANKIADGVSQAIAGTRAAFTWTGSGIRELSRRVKASHV